MTRTMVNPIDDSDHWESDLEWDEGSVEETPAWAPYGRRPIDCSNSGKLKLDRRSVDSSSVASPSTSGLPSFASCVKSKPFQCKRSKPGDVSSRTKYLNDGQSPSTKGLFKVCRSTPRRRSMDSSLCFNMELMTDHQITESKVQPNDLGSSCPDFGFTDFLDFEKMETPASPWGRGVKKAKCQHQYRDVTLPPAISKAFELSPQSVMDSGHKAGSLSGCGVQPSLPPKVGKRAQSTWRSSMPTMSTSCEESIDPQLPPAFAAILKSKRRKVRSKYTPKSTSSNHTTLKITPDGFPVSSQQSSGETSSESAPSSTKPGGSLSNTVNNTASVVDGTSEPAWLLRLRWNGKKDPNVSKFSRPNQNPEAPASPSLTSPQRCISISPPNRHAVPTPNIDGEGGRKQLTWTREREGNFSDWVIVVVTGWSASDSVETYHVHKSIVGFGQRRSEHFVRDFNQSAAEASSVVELDQRTASLFPKVLDYLYSIHGEPLDIQTTTAVSLCYLAKMFGVRSMMKEAKAFIRKNMNKDSASTCQICV